MEGSTLRYLVFIYVVLCSIFNVARPDDQVVASSAQMGHSIWTLVFDPKFEVCTISPASGRELKR